MARRGGQRLACPVRGRGPAGARARAVLRWIDGSRGPVKLILMMRTTAGVLEVVAAGVPVTRLTYSLAATKPTTFDSDCICRTILPTSSFGSLVSERRMR